MNTRPFNGPDGKFLAYNKGGSLHCVLPAGGQVINMELGIAQQHNPGACIWLDIGEGSCIPVRIVAVLDTWNFY